MGAGNSVLREDADSDTDTTPNSEDEVEPIEQPNTEKQEEEKIEEGVLKTFIVIPQDNEQTVIINPDHQQNKIIQEAVPQPVKDSEKQPLSRDFLVSLIMNKDYTADDYESERKRFFGDDVSNKWRKGDMDRYPHLLTHISYPTDCPYSLHVIRSKRELENFIEQALVPLASILSWRYKNWIPNVNKSISSVPITTIESFTVSLKELLDGDHVFSSEEAKQVCEILLRSHTSKTLEEEQEIGKYGISASDVISMLIEIRRKLLFDAKNNPTVSNNKELDESAQIHLGMGTEWTAFVLDKFMNFIKLNWGIHNQIDGTTYLPDNIPNNRMFFVNCKEVVTELNLDDLVHKIIYNRVKYDFTDNKNNEVDYRTTSEKITLDTILDNVMRVNGYLVSKKFIWSRYNADSDERTFMITDPEQKTEYIKMKNVLLANNDWYLIGIIYQNSSGEAYDISGISVNEIAVSQNRLDSFWRFNVFCSLWGIMLKDYKSSTDPADQRVMMSVKARNILKNISAEVFDRPSVEFSVIIHWILRFLEFAQNSRLGNGKQITYKDVDGHEKSMNWGSNHRMFLDNGPKTDHGSFAVSQKTEFTHKYQATSCFETHKILSEDYSTLFTKLFGKISRIDNKPFYLSKADENVKDEIPEGQQWRTKDTIKSDEDMNWFCISEKNDSSLPKKNIMIYPTEEPFDYNGYLFYSSSWMIKYMEKLTFSKDLLSKNNNFYLLKYIIAYSPKILCHVLYELKYKENNGKVELEQTVCTPFDGFKGYQEFSQNDLKTAIHKNLLSFNLNTRGLEVSDHFPSRVLKVTEEAKKKEQKRKEETLNKNNIFSKLSFISKSTNQENPEDKGELDETGLFLNPRQVVKNVPEIPYPIKNTHIEKFVSSADTGPDTEFRVLAYVLEKMDFTPTS